MSIEEMYSRELNRWVEAMVVNRSLRAELAEAREQIAAYQVRVDNDALRMDPARVEIAADLLRDMAKARSREANLAHPLTADRFSQVLDAD